MLRLFKNKHVVILVIILSASFLLSACNAPTSNIDEQREELNSIYNDLCFTNDMCNYIVEKAYDDWGSFGFEVLFDTEQLNNSRYLYDDKWLTVCDVSSGYRKAIAISMNESKLDIQNIKSNELSDLNKAIKDLYACVDSYAKIAPYYPEGYSKITYLEFYNNHKTEFEKLSSYVTLELQ